jgi:hypothetical protein
MYRLYIGRHDRTAKIGVDIPETQLFAQITSLLAVSGSEVHEQLSDDVPHKFVLQFVMTAADSSAVCREVPRIIAPILARGGEKLANPILKQVEFEKNERGTVFCVTMMWNFVVANEMNRQIAKQLAASSGHRFLDIYGGDGPDSMSLDTFWSEDLPRLTEEVMRRELATFTSASRRLAEF